MNRGNVNTTRDMERATLPAVYMNVDGEYLNYLPGYTQEMDLALLRENITPLDDSRGVTFRVVKYSTVITKVSVKLRTVSGDRLIEAFDVTDYNEDDYSLVATVSFKDLMEKNTEYSLQIFLTTSNGKEIMYHTRVVDAQDYCSGEKIAFVKEFLEKEISLETNGDLKEYMESNYLGDNTTLEYVNIHSSMSQLAFGDLRIKRETQPVINIDEIAPETGVFTATYVVSSEEVGDERKYFVKEYFRIKYTPEATYLLDYNRTMHQISADDASVIKNGEILLGIANPNLCLIESDDGSVISFTNENKLYLYNMSENKLAKLFSFYDNENFDERTTYNAHSIKPLKVDEAGNVCFAVIGYQNRDTYEGKVGITLYNYNGLTNVIEELFFVSSDKPAQIVQRDLEELSYLSRDQYFYFMLDKAIYAINLETKENEIIVENLEENKYSVSSDSSLIVWIEGNDVNSSEKLMLMNLNTKQITEIKASKGEYIKPLAFLGDDFIYGLANKDDVVKESTGRVIFPMYTVKIQNKYGELLKEYSIEGTYVTGVSVEDTMITLQRAEKATKGTSAYTDISNDYISSNQEKEEMANVVNTYTNGIYEKVVRISLKKENASKVILLTPKEVIYEGTKEYELQRAEKTSGYYYVYYGGKLQKIYTNPANAVNDANSNYGTVLNDRGAYVWYRANRSLRNQIMDLSFKEGELKADSETDESLVYCLEKMLEYENVVRNTSYLLSTGETVISIMEEAMEGYDVLDLTQTSLDSILYYVNRDIPVLAITQDQSYLIIGFNQLAVVVLDPYKGTYKLGKNEAEELFYQSGNKFITYVPNK